MISFDRPHFPNPESYLRHFEEAFTSGKTPWEPLTRDELLALAKKFPRLVQRFRPNAEGLRMLGLPANFGEEPQPFDADWQERFCATMLACPKFAKAVGYLVSQSIGGANVASG